MEDDLKCPSSDDVNLSKMGLFIALELASQHWDYKHTPLSYPLPLSHVFWELISGPWACKASICTELSPKPLLFDFQSYSGSGTTQ